MNRVMWLVLLVLGVMSCGGSTTATTSSPVTAAPTSALAAGFDLSGVAFDVHQAPG